jgi:adenylate cyclase
MKKRFTEAGKYFLVPAIVSLVFLALFFTPVYQILELRFYDVMLHLKPKVREQPEILLLNIDELAIAQVGTWPWSRDIVADGLLLLREFGNKAVIFDIEYIDKSPRGVDYRYLEETIPALFTDRFAALRSNTSELFGAMQSGQIPVRDAGDYIADLNNSNEAIQQEAIAAVGRIARDNDAYLGSMARLHGAAFFTVNILSEDYQLINVSPELTRYVKKNFAVKLDNRNPGKKTLFKKEEGIHPTILPIISQGHGAGFPNVVVDSDGVRRRIELIKIYDGDAYAQLVLAPLLWYLGNPEVVVSGQSLILKGAKYTDGTTKDIRIPLTSKGMMLINWPSTIFTESFRHLSFNKLVVHDLYMDNLVKNLTIMEQAGYLSFHQGANNPLDLYRYAESIKEDILAGNRDPADMAEFRVARDAFLAEAGIFLDGKAEQASLDYLDGVLAQPDLDAATLAGYREIRDQTVVLFETLEKDYTELAAIRTLLDKELAGSIAIIGHTGIGTTDIGVNPFEESYMNVGTHASVANTILTGDFIREVPPWFALVFTVLISFGISFIIKKFDPKKGIITGAIAVAVVAVAGILLFALTKIYSPLLTPVLAVFFTVLAVSVRKFIKSETEKSFIRNAFSRYLSADVINQLIQDPERLKLGGDKKVLTALFTDIKGFSALAENLDPNQLVKLLNEYLTAMSDIILDQMGTIDKYEGDAIISFFGAPGALPDHPYRALLAAVRMKRIERELNERLIRDKLTPSHLLTRIGINTGEMVVGNMGTPKKMDYTIMGNAVNLAARLEGVNKQYGTWVLASEAAINEAGNDFVTRKLDRVRVININTPVRLYEVLDEKSQMDRETLGGLEAFHDALTAFEDKNWIKAEKLFTEVLRIIPGDGPSETFLGRCREYKIKPPASSWDGVFNLGVK